MMYVIFFMCVAAAIGYSVYAFRERYLCRKKNEELRDRYKLLKDSIENEPDKNRARYRVAHEQEKIDAVKKRLKEKYGQKILTERKLLKEILDIEKEKAEEMAVDFSAEVHNAAEDLLLRFSQDEMISFFINLLDNAIEAAAGSEEKEVDLTVGRDIQLINSKAKDSMSENEPGKEAVEKYGSGSGILEKYCEEKGLSVTYEDEENRLLTKINMIEILSLFRRTFP